MIGITARHSLSPEVTCGIDPGGRLLEQTRTGTRIPSSRSAATLFRRKSEKAGFAAWIPSAAGAVSCSIGVKDEVAAPRYAKCLRCARRPRGRAG